MGQVGLGAGLEDDRYRFAVGGTIANQWGLSLTMPPANAQAQFTIATLVSRDKSDRFPFAIKHVESGETLANIRLVDVHRTVSQQLDAHLTSLAEGLVGQALSTLVDLAERAYRESGY